MMHDIITDLKQLRLFGMAEAWGEFIDPGNRLLRFEWLISASTLVH